MAVWNYVGFCKAAHKLLPIRTYQLSEETKRELRRAELELKDEEFASGLLFSLLLPLLIVFTCSLILLHFWDFTSVLTFSLLGIVLFCLPFFLFFQLYPSMLASQKISRARGEAIFTLLVLCFNLLCHPSLRKAMQQASKTDGRLSSDLKRVLVGLEAGEFRETREALLYLSKEWKELDETVSEALLDILKSEGSGEPSREIRLERTVNRLIEEVEREAEEELGRIVSPTIYFLSFGSLAVVLVIGLSPLMGMLSGGIGLPFYLLSIGSLVLAFWIFTSLALKKRPLFLPLPKAGLSPSFNAIALSLPVSLIFIPLAIRSPVWLVLGIGLSIALFCFMRIREALRLRRREMQLWREWRRLISYLGEKMKEGKTISASIRETTEFFSGIKPQLQKVLILIEAKSLDPYSAFFGEEEIPTDPLASRVLEASLELRQKSESASADALLHASQMIERLEKVERRFKERMREAISNLWMLSLALLPLVCSISVWVVETFTKITSSLPAGWLFPTGLSTSQLSLLSLSVGILALLLSLSVARYIAGITAPGDAITVLHNIGRTALLSSSIYLVSLFLLSSLA
jgi:integrase